MFRLACLFVAVGLLAQGSARGQSTEKWVKEALPSIVELYRDFHRAPELSFHEEKTGERVAAELKKLGIETTSRVGGFGVVGVVKNGPGATLMLRADTDALPVTEKTELVYASKAVHKSEDGTTTGVMHACGHDIHISNLVGTARFLMAHKDEWSGTLVFVFQPAEERGAGAAAMLEDGLFQRFPKPDLALALHVDATLAVGKVGYRAGYILANVDSVDITVRGRGGHGAHPNTTIDPIVQAARLVLDLQSIVSREINPLEPSVVTVGSIHGGTKHNIISDSCQLQLTVRSFSDEVREKLLSAIRRKALAAAASSGAPEPEIKVSEGTPALFNDADLVDRIVPVFQKAIGERNVVGSEQSMGGEDFSRYGRAGIPVFMYRLGAVEASRLARYKQLGQEPPSLHSPLFYPDAEEALETGMVTMVEAVKAVLKK